MDAMIWVVDLPELDTPNDAIQLCTLYFASPPTFLQTLVFSSFILFFSYLIPLIRIFFYSFQMLASRGFIPFQFLHGVTAYTA